MKEVNSELKNLKQTIDESKKEINKIIEKLKNYLNNLDIYYKISYDIISNYENKKRNYPILQNINDINNFMKNLNKTIPENSIVNKMDKIQPMTDRIAAALLRLKSNLELTEDKVGSNIANAEVIPAKNIARKNKGASTLAIGPMTLKIIGNTSNTNPVPPVARLLNLIPEWRDMNPRIENTPNAVNISKNEFAATTISTLSVNLEFSGK